MVYSISPDIWWGEVHLPFVPQGDAADKCDATEVDKNYQCWVQKNNMQKRSFNIEYEVYGSIDDLKKEDTELLASAREFTKEAYAPYSNFYVSAIAKLVDGNIVKGTNQENASYPVGICAERVLLSNAAILFNNVAIDTIAISYDNKNGESTKVISPCGMCRQALVEYEQRVKHPIRIILSGLSGEVYVIKKANELLPLAFNENDMK